MTAHKHAHLMAQYAQDALETDKPWTLWERRDPEYSGEWLPILGCPSWLPSWEYRRKPRTLTYSVTIPEPLRKAPEKGTEYWLAKPDRGAFTSRFKWNGDTNDMLWLKRGLCFATKEDAVAAAKAMMPIKGEEA